MLKRFEVEGFKNFAQRLILDFSDVRDYKFNTNCIRDNLLNKLIIYGKNSVGKSNFGLAVFDIVSHLTDNNVTPGVYDFYLNADSESQVAEFTYLFSLNQSDILYTYRKSDLRTLLYESVSINGEVIFSYDFITKKGDFSGLQASVPMLNFEFREKNLSVLRYIVSNSKSEDIPLLSSVVKFVSHMLWFRSLDENRYIGYKTDSTDYFKFIFEGNNLNEFESFLNQSGIPQSLTWRETASGDKVLCFNNKKPLPFHKVASNGTKALYTVFYWLKTSNELSLLFIDEFDAYYHVELSEAIVEKLENAESFQTILTSHNTNLLSNRIMRPDCYFILTPEKIISFANATDRELREGHNLEKLYVSGEFDEQRE